MERWIAWGCWIILALTWLEAVRDWPALPARIPIHFDLLGRPDSFVDRSLEAWFLAPVIATLLNLGLALIPLLVRWLALHHPQFINMPSREWYELNSEARLRALNPVLRVVGVLRLLVSAIGLYLVGAIALVATGAWATLPVWPLFALIGCMLASVAWLVFASFQGVKKETQDSSFRP